MIRREFITLLGGAAAWPFAVRAQQGERIRHIGVLMGWPESHDKARSGGAALREELQKLGWTEGRNIEIDTRWAAADVESRHWTRPGNGRCIGSRKMKRPPGGGLGAWALRG